ncbi:phage protein [Lacticaseibacillus paracasei subsp. paracasei Lpp126]|uniref:Phage protein n=1 Tax=Lacticaseibacillus paracasei subsp. paracasei Lpp126 TaxID=1256206 RepID=S2R8Q4_LACPA|nr:phage protein [Lacticaseibacillus paracasei subsp. paracasei Lpp126]
MSKEKLYAVKDDEGEYWEFDTSGFLIPHISGCLTTASKKQAEIVADEQGGHVVTFVEEPEKVVLTKEQAEIVENARGNKFPSDYMSSESDDEELLMNAYVNGYTVAKEKKYRVLAPKSWWQSEDKPKYMHRTFGISAYRGAGEDSVFTQKQLDLYELNGAPFTKEEVTDDAD